jgi:thymidylate kinase
MKKSKPLLKDKYGPPMIALVGVDGCGKSAVIDDLRANYSHPHVGQIYIINRSSRAPVSGKPIQNYDKPPHSALVSMAKLCVLAVRWILVYWLKLFKLKKNKALILCDHFYFTGNAIDPLRYRYGGPQGLVSGINRVIPRPDIYIFLDAPLEVVYARKQEATREEVQALIEKYRAFISQIPNGYTVDASMPLEKVVHHTSQIISHALGDA